MVFEENCVKVTVNKIQFGVMSQNLSTDVVFILIIGAYG